MKNLFVKTLISISTTLILTSAGFADTTNTTLLVNDPWSRATPPGATTAAGFMQIVNPTDQADRLVGFSAAISAKPEIHTHKHVDGVMTMTKLEDGLVIPANGKAVLKPMSDHLMLLELKDSLSASSTFTVTAHFENAGDMDIVFDVLSVEDAQAKIEKTMQHDSAHGEHGKMKGHKDKKHNQMDMKHDAPMENNTGSES
jgi:copper(I)-binding protein